MSETEQLQSTIARHEEGLREWKGKSAQAFMRLVVGLVGIPVCLWLLSIWSDEPCWLAFFLVGSLYCFGTGVNLRGDARKQIRRIEKILGEYEQELADRQARLSTVQRE